MVRFQACVHSLFGILFPGLTQVPAAFMRFLASTYGPGSWAVCVLGVGWDAYKSRTTWFWTIRTLWSGAINNLEDYSKVRYRYAPCPYLTSILLQEHIANMLLEQCAFQIWSWIIFDLENSFRLWMIQDHKVLMIWPWTISRGQNLQKARRPAVAFLVLACFCTVSSKFSKILW